MDDAVETRDQRVLDHLRRGRVRTSVHQTLPAWVPVAGCQSVGAGVRDDAGHVAPPTERTVMPLRAIRESHRKTKPAEQSSPDELGRESSATLRAEGLGDVTCHAVGVVPHSGIERAP